MVTKKSDFIKIDDFKGLIAGFLPEIFFRGSKSIVMLISIVMNVFYCFGQNSQGGGGKLLQGTLPPMVGSQIVLKQGTHPSPPKKKLCMCEAGLL